MSEDHNHFVNGSATDSRESFGIIEGNTPFQFKWKILKITKKLETWKIYQYSNKL